MPAHIRRATRLRRAPRPHARELAGWVAVADANLRARAVQSVTPSPHASGRAGVDSHNQHHNFEQTVDIRSIIVDG